MILSTYWRTASVRNKLYWWFYRHTGEQPQTVTNYTGDFIGIIKNSHSQEQTILVILSAYWRKISDRSKLYGWFYRHTGEQPQAGANYTGDFIGRSNLRQGPGLLAILSAYWRTTSDRCQLYWWFYRHTWEQPQTVATFTVDFIGVLSDSFIYGLCLLLSSLRFDLGKLDADNKS